MLSSGHGSQAALSSRKSQACSSAGGGWADCGSGARGLYATRGGPPRGHLPQCALPSLSRKGRIAGGSGNRGLRAPGRRARQTGKGNPRPQPESGASTLSGFRPGLCPVCATLARTFAGDVRLAPGPGSLPGTFRSRQACFLGAGWTGGSRAARRQPAGRRSAGIGVHSLVPGPRSRQTRHRQEASLQDRIRGLALCHPRDSGVA